MNVPSQKRPYQPEGQIEAVQAVSPLLAGVVIECAEYSAAQPMPGLLYADPPYLGTWAGYRSGWGPGHTVQVARLAREHGHSAVHDTDAAATIHEGASTVEFAHVYRVGKSKRGTSKEVLYVYEKSHGNALDLGRVR
jgi:site-specific DNA-adenine methylase